MASLSALQTNTLALDWLHGVNDGVMRRCSYPVPETPWYLLPVAWLDQWKAALGAGTAALPTIDNSPFVLEEDRHRLEVVNDQLRPVKRDLVLGRDYALVPEKAWKYFKQAYGSTTDIKRLSQVVETYKTSVEVQLEGVQLAFLYRQGADIQVTDAKLAYFSRLDSLYLVRNTLKAFFIREFVSDLPGEYIVRLWLLTSPLSSLKLLVQKPTSEMLFPGKLLTDEVRLCDISPISSMFVAEMREPTREKVLFALHEMACQTCRRQIGSGGVVCVCNAAYFCDKMCMLEHKCVLFSPTHSDEDTCFHCTNNILGTAFTCACMEVLSTQHVFCNEDCYRQGPHQCQQFCANCGSVLPVQREKCSCGGGEYCCSFCAASHGCSKPQCPTCLSEFETAGVPCQCEKVRAR